MVRESVERRKGKGLWRKGFAEDPSLELQPSLQQICGIYEKRFISFLLSLRCRTFLFSQRLLLLKKLCISNE